LRCVQHLQSEDSTRRLPGAVLSTCRVSTCGIMVIPAGCLVYHGPREEVVPFFESLGFRLPPRKGTADFLQEITSKKDQPVCPQPMPASHARQGSSPITDGMMLHSACPQYALNW
jgi:hypothetical protein